MVLVFCRRVRRGAAIVSRPPSRGKEGGGVALAELSGRASDERDHET